MTFEAWREEDQYRENISQASLPKREKISSECQTWNQKNVIEAGRKEAEKAYVKGLLSDLGIQWQDNSKVLTSTFANRLLEIGPVYAKFVLSSDFLEIARVVSNGNAELEEVFRLLYNVIEIKSALYFDYEEPDVTA